MSFNRLLTAVLVAAFASAAQAGTIHVDDDNCPGPGDGTEADPYCSIQTAIDNAVDTDEIVVAPGTYLESINYLGKEIAVRSSDGASVTTLDAGAADTVIRLLNGEGPGAVLDGFTITGGSATDGAGMTCSGSEPTVMNCIFVGNHVSSDFGRGGGVLATDLSSVTLIDCAFVGNTAYLGAGLAAHSLSNLNVTNCVFRENRATSGGGIDARGFSQVVVTDSRFVENGLLTAGGGGGGIAAFDSDLIVRDSVFTGNEASGGGAVAAGFGTLSILDCDFVGNAADFVGGAIVEGNDATSIVNCLFSSNEGSHGGGIITASGYDNLTVINCTFSNNFPTGFTEDAEAAPIMSNCIFWGNVPDQIAPGFPEDPIDAGVFFCDVQGGWSGSGSDNIDADPQFVGGPSGQWTDGGVFDPAAGESTFTDTDASFAPGALVGKCLAPLTLVRIERPIVANSATTITVPGDVALWGIPGFTYQVNDYRLSAGSPCIDAADNTAVPAGVTTDLEGNPRFLEIPETPDSGNGTPPLVDMGAYESLGGGCLAITGVETVCHGGGTAFTVNVEGLNACTGGTTQATFTGSGGAVGGDFCATLVINTEAGGFCCSTQVCVPVPDCSAAAAPCDLDGDGFVGVADFLVLLDARGPNLGHPADFDGDGDVGVSDFLLLLAEWD